MSDEVMTAVNVLAMALGAEAWDRVCATCNSNEMSSENPDDIRHFGTCTDPNVVTLYRLKNLEGVKP
jgi:hypothetical protein